MTIAVVLCLRKPMMSAPWAFYVVGVLLDVLLLAQCLGMLPNELDLVVMPLLRRGFVALSLFVVVMYIGVFPYNGKVRNYLAPVRAVLSIVACILALGHIVVYFSPYVTGLFAGAHFQAPIVASMIAGVVLLILLLLLGVTSFRFVRKRMRGKTWIRLQKLAYLFYALIYVHSMCLLMPPAINGGLAARVSVVVYSVVFGAYAIARTARMVIDHRASQAANRNLNKDRQRELDGQAL
ncbi:ferric reductase-like transmembrane domain-containing protein [Denitrobacterium detoxificans]|uniref:ferric reductase-like transmembrane domain-containing protein n=1 Tax=Denitrobacterium detoxificans TaxID=79604 RepID=UPI0026F148D9|nr:ferric reductase-like transmembrane domain-containing protein [Denitrobacterium detoxificans]